MKEYLINIVTRDVESGKLENIARFQFKDTTKHKKWPGISDYTVNYQKGKDYVPYDLLVKNHVNTDGVWTLLKRLINSLKVLGL